MKKSKFTESQIVKILGEQENGKSVADICREHGISQPTLYGWKSKFGGMDVNQLERIKELEAELAQYKKIVAEQTLSITVLKDVIEKALRPDEKRELVRYAKEAFQMSIHQACGVFGLSETVYYYKAKNKSEDIFIEDELRSLAEVHTNLGFWMMFYHLRLNQQEWNHKRVYRVYRNMKLNMRRKYKRRLPSRVKEPLLQPLMPNITWSMDFMHDSLQFGKTFRSFNVIDDFNREALNITIDTSLNSGRVVRELNQLIDWRGKPEKIRVDNGPEFIAFAMEKWANDNDIELQFIQKGKPQQNGYVEWFNRSYRTEVLDAYAFDNLTQARAITHAWMWSYNNERPHSALNYLTPTQFLLKYGKLHITDATKEFPTFQHDNINNSLKSIILDTIN